MERRVPTWMVLLALALLAAAARALAFAGTELYADEAYYWLWSLRPAAGYYDHPPLVAWLVALGTRAAPGEAGVRLAFLACGALAVLFAGLLAGELARLPEERGRAAILGALLTAAAPLLAPLGALALPDAPLVAACTAATWLVSRARGPRWLGVGLAAGLALLSKYSAALPWLGLVALLPWDPGLRRQLRTPWPWLGAALALALFAPCLLWNARHGWVSLLFQLRHGLGSRGGGPATLELLGAAVAGAGPVALPLGAAELWRRARAGDPAARRVGALVAAPLLVMALASLRGRVEANWPALAYPALCAAAGCALARARPALRRGLAGASVALTAALLAAFAVVQRHPALLPGSAVVERFQGWREAARAVRAEARRVCPALRCDPEQPYLLSVNYQFAAELAFYGGFRRLGPALERASELDGWSGPPAPHEPFLLVGLVGPPDGGLPGGAVAVGPTVQVQSRRAGQGLRDLSITPFARGASPAAQR